ncbi:FAD-dependent monooxygenase [Saccharothrix sp. MB29]|nr:FAD-dependent monooxygenase [Saccharothrix sp. MB29]
MSRHALVVGSGLAGSLTAVYLARRGYPVRVLERRGDPRAPGVREEGRSINLGLSQRGIVALREIGLLEGLAPLTVPMRGRVVHLPDGLRFQPYGLAEDQILHSVLRHDLNVALVDEAERRGVEFLWGHRVTAVDRAKPAVTALGPDGEEVHTADLVVGADGAFSAVRGHLGRGRRVDLHQEFLVGLQGAADPGRRRRQPRTELRALHVAGDDGLIVAHPNADGSLTATVFLPFDGEHGSPGSPSREGPTSSPAASRHADPDPGRGSSSSTTSPRAWSPCALAVALHHGRGSRDRADRRRRARGVPVLRAGITPRSRTARPSTAAWPPTRTTCRARWPRSRPPGSRTPTCWPSCPSGTSWSCGTSCARRCSSSARRWTSRCTGCSPASGCRSTR